MSALRELSPPKRPVLLVDDNVDIRGALGALLESSGFTVAHASNGIDAVKKLERGLRPCLILLDVAMPDMDGFEFCDWKKRAAYADVPVIAFSGVFDIERIEELLGVPAFKKPMDLDEVLRLVRTHCARD